MENFYGIDVEKLAYGTDCSFLVFSDDLLNTQEKEGKFLTVRDNVAILIDAEFHVYVIGFDYIFKINQ